MNRPAALLRIDALMAAHDAEKAQLQAMISKLELRVAELEEQLRLERARKYGPSSEKRKDRIFNEAEQEAAEDESGEDEETSSRVPDTGRPEGSRPPQKKRGRKPLPADLPRQRVEYDLTDEEKVCPCCREQMHRMGESKTEQLQVEVKAVVLENVRFKYACRNCERTGTSTPVVLAPMPPQPLPGSVATAATLAWVLASKFVDGMPLYRLSTALNRVHVDLSRGTLGHWVVQSSERHLERVYDVLHDRLRGQDVIHGDETRVQVLKEEGRDAQSESYMWA